MDFFSSWAFMGIMAALLVILVAFLVYRLVFMKKEDE